MTKRLLKTLLLPLTVAAAAIAFVACEDGNMPEAKYKVTYSIGAYATGTAPTETDKAAGEKFKIKSADGITCDGMEFTGWSDGNITYQAGDEYTMPSKAVTFTAQWAVPPATYSVTYDLNGGTGETPAVSYKGASETFTLALADGFSYEGKEFDGWSDGTNKYDAGAEYTMSGKPVVFTAQWKDELGTEKQQIYAADELDDKGTILLYDDGTGLLDYYSETEDGNVEVNFTYTLSDNAIVITIGGNTFNGTYEVNGTNKLLTIQFTYASTLFNFGQAQVPPTGKPTVAFDANGGTGTEPVIADADIVYDDNSGKYKVTLPQSTFTAPEGKEFDKWAVNTDSNTYKAGQTIFADAGEVITLKAIWKDVEPKAPAGVVFYGNCTLPTKSFLGNTQGGETVLSVIIDNTDAQNIKVYYKLVDDQTYKTSQKTGSAYESYKPDVYGSDALYYGEFKIGDLSYNIVVKSDLTALYLCDTDDELLDDGEFTAAPSAPEGSDKIGYYIGDSSANAIKYGYNSQSDAGSNAIALNGVDYYRVEIYFNADKATVRVVGEDTNKLCYIRILNTSTTITSDDNLDVDSATFTLWGTAITSGGTIAFKFEDGKRKVTISDGTNTVTWEEMA